MNSQRDWLKQTCEIKRKMAEKYADKPASEQVRDMRESVLREWKKRGWTLRESADASAPRIST